MIIQNRIRAGLFIQEQVPKMKTRRKKIKMCIQAGYLMYQFYQAKPPQRGGAKILHRKYSLDCSNSLQILFSYQQDSTRMKETKYMGRMIQVLMNLTISG